MKEFWSDRDANILEHTVSITHPGDMTSILFWCVDYVGFVGQDWSWGSYPTHLQFRFRDAQHATLFALRWL